MTRNFGHLVCSTDTSDADARPPVPGPARALPVARRPAAATRGPRGRSPAFRRLSPVAPLPGLTLSAFSAKSLILHLPTNKSRVTFWTNEMVTQNHNRHRPNDREGPKSLCAASRIRDALWGTSPTASSVRCGSRVASDLPADARWLRECTGDRQPGHHEGHSELKAGSIKQPAVHTLNSN